MKKLLSMLLALVMVIGLIGPVIAVEETGSEEFVAPEISIASTQLTASTLYASTTRDEYIDEETGEVTYSPEWTCYEWYKSSPVTITINGQTLENTTLEHLSGIIGGGQYGQLSGCVISNQSYENQWQVGGTYPVTYYICRTEGDWETIWSVDLSVTLREPPVDIEVSDVQVDELSGGMDGDYRYYDWKTSGRMSVTVDGTAYENVTYNTLAETMEKACGPVMLNLSSPEGIYEDVNKLFEQTQEAPWQVGDEMFGFLTIQSETDGTVLFARNICVRVCETQIESVAIAPITYYAYESSGDPVITVNYKDGTSAVNNSLSYSYEGSWPNTAGSYTMNFTVAGTFQVTVPVTVLPNPTSGSLGDTVTWVYDAQTDTMTLSGTGKAVVAYNRSWTKLLAQLAPKKVVVSEGIEYLEEGIFHYGLFIEELVLPTSLREIPNAMVGFNGPTAGTYLEEEYGVLAGMPSVTVPEGITFLTNHAFYLCWGITDFYLPSTLEELDIDVLCAVVKLREDMGLAAQAITIHFAGTQAQWENVKHVAGATRADFGTGWTDAQLEEVLATFTVEFAEADVQYDPAVMELSGDGKVTAFDAQILAEAKAGLRTLTEEQWAAIGAMTPQDILNYILGK